jgi:hypothetical protein
LTLGAEAHSEPRWWFLVKGARALNGGLGKMPGSRVGLPEIRSFWYWEHELRFLWNALYYCAYNAGFPHMPSTELLIDVRPGSYQGIALSRPTRSTRPGKEASTQVTRATEFIRLSELYSTGAGRRELNSSGRKTSLFQTGRGCIRLNRQQTFVETNFPS